MGEAVKRIWTAQTGLLALLLTGCTGLVKSGGNGTTPPPAGQLSVTPSSATLRGGDIQTFTAATNDGTTPVLAWSVNGLAGGNAMMGLITASGVYTAPQFPPATNTVTIGVTETVDTTKTASSAVLLENPTPQLVSVTPTSIPVGAFTLTATGTNFAPGATILFGTATLTTTRVSSTQLMATGTATASQVGSVAITVQNPDPGLIVSAKLNAQVIANSAIAVAVVPPSATVRAGNTQSFTATVTGTTNTAVAWSVNGVAGGNATTGTISAAGLYTAPANLPTPNTITVTASSAADATKKANSGVTLENPIPVLVAVTPNTLGTGAFMLTLTGSGFVKTSVVTFGGQTLTTMYVSPTELDATGSVAPAQTGSIPVVVQNPNPGGATSATLMAQILTGGTPVTAVAAVRMLEQSTFGPTPELVNQVQQLGFDPFLQNQITAPVSTYPDPLATDMGVGKVQSQFFLNAVNGGDQLRQRLGFALNELWVVSQNKVGDPTGYTNYIRALENDGLGNYFDVMRDVTLTPAMGHYLDMVNNDKPGTGQHANENYARELMQLFTLGLSQLNPDGTPQLDGTGNPIPTYTQDDVMALGRSFTGWTYPTTPGQALQKHNQEYYGGPMLPFESNHDGGAKTLLGQPVAAGQSAEQELNSVLTIIFNHPNLPPFVAQQLIKKLVTSNPSPAYVARVASAFSNGKFQSYGSGKRGDMQATVAAILLDSEARRGDSATTADPGDGKLREPVVMMVSVARAFHATTDGGGFTNSGGSMSQSLFNSGSVFNFFPPANLIAGTTLNGPEFAIFNTNTSLARVNFINTIVYGQVNGATKLDFTPVINAGTPDQMADWLNTLFLHGTMSSAMKQNIVTAVNAVTSTDTKNQARAAIYLVASSSQYQVQR
jgi:uncharacterized protein (DUF1800 family)